eukprot:TRINITY_DN2279_c0_g1_i1.p1 TRINITY_DN2279_c0_g1~~TRINITY_DN2279_c0_g1_i1.p1  ORF type:complete len:424 (-),score=115.57 TRINITY_DN2279_c0_g1_i1:13-1284(-)
MSVFKKIGKELHDAKNTSRAKWNSTFNTGTSDTEFDKHRSDLLRQKKNMKRLQKYVIQFQTAANHIKIAQDKIAKTMGKIVEDEHSPAALTANGFAAETERNAKISESSLKLDAVSMIDAYLVQYTEMERRMDERFSRLNAMDKAEKELKNMEHKSTTTPGIRTEDYRNNYTALKSNYDGLNEELKNDIGRLIGDRKVFMEVFYPCVVDGQIKYFNACHTSGQGFSSYAMQANPERVRNYAHVITPNGSSCMYVHSRPASFSSVVPVQSNPIPPSMPPPQIHAPMNQPPSMQPPQMHPPMQPHAMQNQHPTQPNPFNNVPRTSVGPTGNVNVPPGNANMGAPRPRAVSAGGNRGPVPLPKPPGLRSAPLAKALYDFNASDNTELSFKSGDQLTILAQDGSWWKAELRGRQGTIPSNYVQLLSS